MRDDLLDAYASIEWAESQLDTLHARIGAWLNDSPDVVRADKNPQTGEEVWHIDPRERVPRLINAEAGAIINGVRSSLDLLATTLAQRHCKRLIKDAYFPICGNVGEWDGRGLKRIKRLSTTDQATIKGLQPCFGGDNLLLALNQLDNIRKHQRVISFFSHSVGMSVYKVGFLPSELDAIYRTQAPENGYVLARNVSDPDYQIHVRVEITSAIFRSWRADQSSPHSGNSLAWRGRLSNRLTPRERPAPAAPELIPHHPLQEPK